MKAKHLLYVINLLVKLLERVSNKSYKKANEIGVQITTLRGQQLVLDNESLHAARVASKLKAIVE